MFPEQSDLLPISGHQQWSTRLLQPSSYKPSFSSISLYTNLLHTIIRLIFSPIHTTPFSIAGVVLWVSIQGKEVGFFFFSSENTVGSQLTTIIKKYGGTESLRLNFNLTKQAKFIITRGVTIYYKLTLTSISSSLLHQQLLLI